MTSSVDVMSRLPNFSLAKQPPDPWCFKAGVLSGFEDRSARQSADLRGKQMRFTWRVRGYTKVVQTQQEHEEPLRRSLAPNGVSAGSALRVEGPLTVESLSRIRQAIVGRAAAWRLDDSIVETVQTVSSELAANIIAHAGGEGMMILTCRPGALYCQAVDHGPGMRLPFLAGWQAPDIGDPAAARGLWTVRMLSARVQIDSSILGTTVTAALVWK